MAEPFISVVIPTYNRAGHIPKTIQSVLQQNFTDYEIIIIDDGSTDNTEEVVGQIVSEKIRYIKRINSERGASRNAGTRLAAGKYVQFLDSDDLLLPHHLQTVHDFIHAHRTDKVFCFSYQIDLGNRTREITLSGDINHQLAAGNLLSCNGVVLERQLALRFLFSEDRDLSGLEDWELWLRLAAEHPFVPCEKITTVIIQHDDRSVMQTTPASIEKKFNSFYRHFENNEQVKKYYRKSRRKFYSSCETYMALHLAMTRLYGSSAMGHLWKGIMWNPGCMFTRRFLAIFKHLF